MSFYFARIPADICAAVGFQEAIRVTPAVQGPNRPRFGHIKVGLCTGWACKRIMAPVLEPYNSISPRFYWESELSRVELPEAERLGLVDLP